jgi:hypothetical protein
MPALLTFDPLIFDSRSLDLRRLQSAPLPSAANVWKTVIGQMKEGTAATAI